MNKKLLTRLLISTSLIITLVCYMSLNTEYMIPDVSVFPLFFLVGLAFVLGIRELNLFHKYAIDKYKSGELGKKEKYFGRGAIGFIYHGATFIAIVPPMLWVLIKHNPDIKSVPMLESSVIFFFGFSMIPAIIVFIIMPLVEKLFNKYVS